MPYDSQASLPANVKKLPDKSQRQWMHVWNSSYAACMREEFGTASKCESEAFAKANGVVKGSEPLDEQYAYDEGAYRLFVGSKSFSSPVVEDGWYPFLPKPGKFTHPQYGEVNITREGNQALVESVKQGVYQEHIPIDAEHQTKLSGAVAWLKDMRLNEDGSADGFFEWTGRGRMLMSGGQFKYVSPEFFGAWPDPATGVVHHNVVSGGALTTRPFFKGKVLRALVASEGAEPEVTNAQEYADMADSKAKTKVCPDCGMTVPASTKVCADCGHKFSEAGATSDPKEEPIQMNEAEVQAKIDAAVAAAQQTFSETLTAQAAQFAELSTRVEAAEATAKTEREARESATNELAAIKAAERARRFSEIVSGKGGSGDGAAWIGDPSANVGLLAKLADTFGEDSDDFKAFVESQSAAAAQLNAAVFKEYGRSDLAANGASTPSGKLDALVAAKMAEKNINKAQAYSEVLATDQGMELYNAVGQAR